MNFTLPGGALFSSPSIGLLPPPPPIPDESDAQVKARVDKARIAAQKRKGLLSTNLTSKANLGSEAETKHSNLGGSA